MAHRRKKRRTQAPGQKGSEQSNGAAKTNPADRIPKSMVIRIGASEVGPSVTQLVKDMRSVMEPHTASRLKERRSNKLRDYKSMAGPLGVSHLLLFSRSNSGNTNLRMAVTPRGPTLNFNVEKYSLCRDVTKAQKRPKAAGGGVEHLSPPLLVMNNFTSPTSTATTSIPKHLENLATTVFQSLFPPISPQRTPLSSIRRVLLVNREYPKENEEDKDASEQGTYVLSIRHYAITTRPLVPLSRGLKRLRAASSHARSRAQKPQPTREGEQGIALDDGSSKQKPKSRTGSKASLPNLSRLGDVADYLLDPSAAGYTSASETEIDTDAEVEVYEPTAKRVLNRREREKLRQAVHGENRSTETPPMDADGEEDESPHSDEEQKSNRASKTSNNIPPPPPQKRAIKLTELGPRLRLRLVKVEEGLCEGKVLWHEFVTKTAEEEKALDDVWEGRRKVKEERRRLQKENVERKKKDKKGGNVENVNGDGDRGEGEGEVGDEVGSDDEWDDDDFDDDEFLGDVQGTEREQEEQEDEDADEEMEE